jgi:hypothetical protein
MSTNLPIQLKAHRDGRGKVYYVGKVQAPITIDCKDGVTFFVFTSETDAEELQIAPMIKNDKKHDVEYKSKEPVVYTKEPGYVNTPYVKDPYYSTSTVKKTPVRDDDEFTRFDK